MSKKTDNITKVDFGTPEPNVVETTAEQEAEKQEYINMCFSIGQSTLEWISLAKKEDYVQHMSELYDIFHTGEAENKDESKIVVPKREIILPN